MVSDNSSTLAAAIASLTHRFEAFAAGRLSAQELRAAVHQALSQQPQLVSAAMELVSKFGRRGVLATSLEADLIDDINALAPTRSAGARSAASGVFEVPEGILSSREAPLLLDEPIYADPLRARPRHAPIPPPAQATLSGTILKQRYELIDELGRGTLAVVYRALDRSSTEGGKRARFVAIKVLSESFQRHALAVRSLQHEAQKAQQLAHPNIGTLLEFDRDASSVYLVTELLTGHALGQQMHGASLQEQSLRRVREILSGIAAALSNAHEQGIVHGDLKPSNVFVTDTGRIKVLDFGVAAAIHTLLREEAGSRADVAAWLASSAPYSSPELLNGEAAQIRDDVYSFACVSYELLTGQQPFGGLDAVKARAVEVRPAAPRMLTRAQWAVLRSGLAFTREQRPDSVQQLFNGLFTGSARRVRWPWVSAAVLLLGAGAVALAYQQRLTHEATQLAQGLSSADPAQFAAALTQLHRAAPSMRMRVLADTSARTKLLQHYTADMDAATTAPEYDFARARSELDDLMNLLPAAPQVQQLREHLQQTLRADISQQLGKRDSALANGILLPSQGSDDLVTVLARIRHLDPTQAALSDPRIGAAYVAAAQMADMDGKADLAESLLQAGMQLLPNDPRLLQAKQAADAELKREGTAQQIVTLEARLAPIDENAADLLDQVLAKRDDFITLSMLAPDDPQVVRLRAKLQTAALARVQDLLKQGDLAGARQILDAARQLLPDQLTQSALPPPSPPQQAPPKPVDQTETLRAQLSMLLAKPELSNRWAEQVRALLDKLAAQPSADQVALNDERHTAVAPFIKAAAEARAQQDLGRAASMLTIARGIDAQAGELAGATQQLIGAYVQRARSQAIAGNVDDALSTLADGRHHFGASMELKNLELRYVTLGDAYDRLSTAVVLNVSELRQYLNTIRGAEGADYAAIERMLMHTLANRIADMRAANRPAVAGKLLQAGQQLFPNDAAELSQGKAGVLPDIPLAVEGP